MVLALDGILSKTRITGFCILDHLTILGRITKIWVRNAGNREVFEVKPPYRISPFIATEEPCSFVG